MGDILESEVRIHQATSGVTLTAGTADTEKVIAEYVIPDATAYKIRPGDILSLTLKDTTPTEIAGTSLVKVVHADSQGRVKLVVAEAPYTALVEWSDRNKLFTFGQEVKLKADQRLQIIVTANLAVATAQTKFQISAKMGVESIL